jgi:hypothetical protein
MQELATKALVELTAVDKVVAAEPPPRPTCDEVEGGMLMRDVQKLHSESSGGY